MHGTFLVIFQVFHDFQGLWEPCLTHKILFDRDNNQTTLDRVHTSKFEEFKDFSRTSKDYPTVFKD